MAKIVESESDKELVSLLVQVKESRDKWQAEAERWKALAGELFLALEEDIKKWPGASSHIRARERLITKAREAGL